MRRRVSTMFKVVISTALMAAGAVVGAVPSSANHGGTHPDIVYLCNIAPFGNDICGMNADGGNQVDITSSPSDDAYPVGSPDGTKVAFSSDRDQQNNHEIYVMNGDGTGVTRLTNSPNSDSPSAWSPNGAKILFFSDRVGNNELYVMNADGSGVTRLTNSPGSDAEGDWSPDGTRIVFSSTRDHMRNADGFDAPELYVMNADGSGQARLTNNNTQEGKPAWSPDGTRIAFSGAGSDIYVMNPDGTGQVNLTNTPPPTNEFAPDWSPDGTRLVYTDSSEIYVMNADGSGKTNITHTAFLIEAQPNWQPIQGPPLPPPPPPPPPTSFPVVEPPATLAPATTYPTGQFNPWQVAVADFNRDGIQDLAVATPLSSHPEFNTGGELAVLLGTGGGGFGPPAHPAVGEGPRSVAAGDFNEDGIVDLAVANSGGGGVDDVSVLLGIGDGSFAPPAFFGTGTTGRPHMLVVADLNGDGFDDVAMANFEPPPTGGDLSVLLGTGTGTLGVATNHHTGFGTSSIALGDFNEDGVTDLVVTNLLGGNLAVLLGIGGGNFGPAALFSGAGANPNIVAVGDFNGDGHADLAATMIDGGVSVQLGTGTGTFGPGKNYSVGIRPTGVAVGDFNGDGRADLAVANSGQQSNVGDTDTVSVLLGTGAGAFGAPTTLLVGDSPFAVTVGDFNNDTWPDLAVGNNYSSNVSVLLNTDAPRAPARPVTKVTGSAYGYYTNVGLFGGDPTAQGPAPTVTLPSGGGTRTAVDPDGATATYGPAAIFEATGPLSVATKGTTGPRGYVTSATQATGVGPGPFTADHLAGFCTASATVTAAAAVVNGVVVLHDPNPNATGEAGEQIVAVPTNPTPGTEYSGVVAGANDNFRIVFNEQTVNPDGSVTVNAAHMYLQGPSAIGDVIIGQAKCGVTQAPVPPADFNGDAKTDFSVYRPSDGVWYVAGGTSGGWGAAGDIAVPGDYTGDGKTDFAVYRPSTGAWYVNGGINGFWGGSPGDIPVPGDYNGDAKTDFAVYRPSTGAWYVNGGTSAFWGTDGDIPVPDDYNGDGITDIAVFRPSTGAWYVLGGTAAFWGTAGDIAVPGDYNGDGKTDFAVYRPSTGAWYVNGGTSGLWGGAPGDIPVPGDYNGDAKTDFAIFRPSTGIWYVNGGPGAFWGTAGDVPLPLPYAIRRGFP